MCNWIKAEAIIGEAERLFAVEILHFPSGIHLSSRPYWNSRMTNDVNVDDLEKRVISFHIADK